MINNPLSWRGTGFRGHLSHGGRVFGSPAKCFSSGTNFSCRGPFRFWPWLYFARCEESRLMNFLACAPLWYGNSGLETCGVPPGRMVFPWALCLLESKNEITDRRLCSKGGNLLENMYRLPRGEGERVPQHGLPRGEGRESPLSNFSVNLKLLWKTVYL